MDTPFVDHTWSSQQHDDSSLRLISAEHRSLLRTLDTIFGGYCVAMVLLALFAWLHDDGSLGSVLVLSTFLGANTIISLVAYRAQQPFRVEVVRVILGAAMSTGVYLLADGPFLHWWPGFLIMCLGGTMMMILLTGNAHRGRLLVGSSLVLLVANELLGTPHMDWYAFAVNAGVIAMVGLLFVEVVALLGHVLDRERHNANERLHASETYFRTLIENASDGICVVDREGRLTYTSPSWDRMLGQKVGALLGTSFHQLIHPDDLAQAVADFTRIVQSPGDTFASETRVHHGDGSWRTIEGFGHLLPNGDIVTNVRDVTERRRLEQELRRLNDDLERRVAERTAQLEMALAESRRLTQILEATTDIVGLATVEGHMLYLNQAGRRSLGFSDQVDITGINFSDLYPPASLEYLATVGIPSAMRAGIWSGETMIVAQDGHEIPVSIVGIAHRTSDGVPTHLSAVLRDISERKRAEAELQAAKEAAEEATRAKSSFLANMSHEIRTPMNGIIGMTDLLLDTDLSHAQRDFVETIRTSGDALLTIINDILDFSKIEAGRLDLDNHPFDLRACVEQALDLLVPRAAEKGLDVAVQFDATVPATIMGDEVRLRQILVNLLSNAIKFTERGEVVVTVKNEGRRLKVEHADGTDQSRTLNLHPSPFILSFSVRDTGIGIPSNRIDRLFQSFSQLDPSTTRTYGGTGLGLVISKRLAELMGGTLWVESTPEQGSTFAFTLDAVAAPHVAPVYLSDDQPQLSGKHVLVVDDNATNRMILCHQLASWGMTCATVASGAEALTLLDSKHHFDLALLDMDMPEMNGIALAACIRQRIPSGNLPLVMLSSVTQRTADLGAIAFAAVLTKPVKASQLYNTLVAVFMEHEVPERTNRTFWGHGRFDVQLGLRMPLRILLAEDNVINQKVALLELERLGYAADIAANGQEVLMALQRQPYDLILMDVHMPVLNGLEATRRIRASQELAVQGQPLIVAMTANAMQGDRELCLAAGMDDYISKPVHVRELRAALERAGRQKMHDRASFEQDAFQTNPSVDWTALERLGDPATARELITLFLIEAPTMLAAMRAAVEQGDGIELHAAAHSLKGSSAYIGARRMVTLLAELERLVPDSIRELAPSLLTQTEDEWSRVQDILAAWTHSKD